MNFGTQLRRWRRDASLTLADVSSELGLSVVHISQVERGSKNPPGASVLLRWLAFLDQEDEFDDMLLRSTRARKSLKISLAGRSDNVVDMAGSLARQVEDGEIDDDTAMKIFNLLNKSKTNGETSSKS